MSEVVSACSSTLSHCVCALADSHDGHHLCECGGSWDVDGNPVLFPGGRTKEECAEFIVDVLLNPLALLTGLGMFGDDE